MSALNLFSIKEPADKWIIAACLNGRSQPQEYLKEVYIAIHEHMEEHESISIIQVKEIVNMLVPKAKKIK